MLEATRKRGTLTVRLAGELDHCSAQSIRRELDALLADPGITNLVLDMQKLTLMDSSGIGVILGRYRTVAARGGTVSVAHMNAHVARVFHLSGMQQIIGIIQ